MFLFITFGHEIWGTLAQSALRVRAAAAAFSFEYILRAASSHLSAKTYTVTDRRKRIGQFRKHLTLDERIKQRNRLIHTYITRRSFTSVVVCIAAMPLVSPIIIIIIWCRTMSSLFASWLLIRMLPLGIRRCMNGIRYALRACASMQVRDVTYLHVS